MKKVTVCVGCASKRHTLRGVEQFLAGLKALGDVEWHEHRPDAVLSEAYARMDPALAALFPDR